MKLLRTILIGLAVLVILAVAGLAISPIGQVLVPVGVGIAAKHQCSLVFVGGLDPERARRLYVDPVLGPAPDLVTLEVNREDQSVTGSTLGVYRARAVHREGLGCTLVHGADAALPSAAELGLSPRPAPERLPLDTAHRDLTFDVASLEAALDRAFAPSAPDRPRNTFAVVVLQDGKLVAERYAEDIDFDTPLPGWSMTKSVTATLAGILAREDRVDMDAPGAIELYRGTDDPRSAITLDHLLRMTSGLEISERQDGLDPTSQLLFLEPDAAAYSAARPLQKEPGTYYSYMSGSTVLAMARVQDIIEGGLAADREWVQEVLFRPLAMHTAVIEPDQSGTFIGGSFMLAGAHDWARFGQLYADGGVTAQGQRLIDSSWVDYVSTHTEQSGSRSQFLRYGSGFWLAGARPGENGDRPFPADTIYASGFQGQYIMISPTENIVVVRLGADTGGGTGIMDLYGSVLAARL